MWGGVGGMSHFIARSVARRLTVAFVVLAVIATFISTAVQTRYAYETEREKLERQLSQVQAAHASSLAQSVWNFSESRIRTELQGMLNVAGVEHIAIRETGGAVWEVGKRTSKNSVARETALIHFNGREDTRVGTLKIVAGQLEWWDFVRLKALGSVVNNGILIFFLAGSLLLIFRQQVTRHLNAIARYATVMTLDKTTQPLKLNRASKLNGPMDELDQVVFAFNTMRIQLAQSMAELQYSEQRFREFAELASDWLWEMDADFCFTFISSGYGGRDNFDPTSVLGLTRNQTALGDIRSAKWQKHFDDLNNHRPFRNFEYRPKIGKGRVVVRISGNPIFDKYGSFKGYRGTGTDITARVENEKSLRESEERYKKTSANLRNLIDGASAPIIVVNGIGQIVEWNMAAAEVVGHKKADVLYYNFFNEFVPAHARTDALDVFYKTLSGESVSNFELAVNAKSGGEVKLLTGATLQRGDEGGLDFVIFAGQDMTSLIAAEEALRRVQKMEAVGELSGGIAHDFNNILSIIQGNLEILQRLVGDNEKVQGRLETALKGVKRGADLTRKLLKFSRIQAYQTEITSVNKRLLELQQLIGKSLTVAIDVEQHLADDLWLVDVDPGDLQDAILNMALNARDAMPDGGKLVFETANKILDEDYVHRNPQSKVGEFVRLSIHDTGCGMTPEVRDRMFEPFFSTKVEGRGTGLGLSMVYGFVQRSGGHMNIYSKLGEGTKINMYLPRAVASTINTGMADHIIEIPEGTETILVVDDEAELAEIATFNLQELGYTIHTAHNAQEALAILKDNPQIDLLFSDVIMPGELDGYQLAFAAKKAHPDIKVLLCSGFSKQKEKYDREDAGFQAELIGTLLHKPYNLTELALAVRCVLDKGTNA